MSIPTRIFGFLLISTLLCFPVAWGKNETPRESQKILEKANVELPPDTNQKFSDLELKIKRVEKELGKIDAKINEVNQRVLLHDEALLSKDEPPRENWWVVLISILGALGAAIAGGLLVGHFQKKAVQQEHQNAMDRQESEEKTQVHSFLEGIHGEIECLWNFYQQRVGTLLENLNPGDPFLVYFFANKDYFPVFTSNAHLLGKIKDSGLRRTIIQTYTAAKGLLDTYSTNNYFLQLRDHYDALYNQTQQPAIQQTALAWLNGLKDYAPKLRQAHDESKQSTDDLIAKLKAIGIPNQGP